MPPLVRYGLLALLGVVVLVAGLLLSARPALGGGASPTLGAVLFLVGAAAILVFLAAAYRPRPSRRRPPQSSDGDDS